MNKHNYRAITEEVQHIVHEVSHMEKEEAEELFGIELKDDGSVFDPTYNKTFESVSAWAEWNAEEDEAEFGEDMYQSKVRYDDYA